MTLRSAAPRGGRFRTITLAGIAGICTAVGPLALPAMAASDPALSLSVSSVRPGVPFIISSGTDCPAANGTQTVDFSFTDSDGTYSELGSLETDDDGSWAATSLSLPVVGVDADGGWQGDPVAAGRGTVDATCTAADSGDDFEDASAHDPADDNGNDNSGDDEGDDSGDDVGTITQTYAAATLTASGSAPQLSVSPAVAQPGGSVTVTPDGSCPSGSGTSVALSVVRIGASGDDDNDDPDNNNSDNSNGDDFDNASADTGAVASGTATASSSGSWSTVSIALPSGADLGDYAVTADCVAGGKVVGSYDAAPIALGTLTLGTPTCSADGATVALKGSYDDDVAVSGSKRALTLPAKLTLKGSGPWQVRASSATTGLSLAKVTVTCPKPSFDLDVPKTSVGATGKLRANVCNTGKRSVSAVLQVAKGGRFKAVDDEKLSSGECSWLTGGKLAKGDSVKARVLLDAPGSSSDEVSASFTARRPRH